MIAEEGAENIAHVPAWAAPARSRIGRAWVALAQSVAYIALYLTLDRFSFIEASTASASRHGAPVPGSRWRC